MRRWFTAAVVLLGMAGTGLAAPTASAARTTCLVVDTNANTSYTSLQAAVNAATAGDTLFVKGTCTGTTIIDKDLTITGQSNGSTKTGTLDGGGQGPILRIGSDVTVTLNRLVITKGDGGIRNDGTLTLNSSTVTGNTSTDNPGGIFNNGTLTLNSSTITGNISTGSAGGIFNIGPLTLNSSTISGNTASSGFGEGGGIYNTGPVTLNGSSTISGNTAFFTGGGIFNNTTVTMNDSSTITGNTAFESGGGIYNDCGTLVGVTVSGNVYGNHSDDIFSYPGC